MTYTVVGLYEDTRQAYADYIAAPDAYAAMAQAKCDTVVCAFEGMHLVTVPCAESGCIAATKDMPITDAELIAAMEEL